MAYEKELADRILSIIDDTPNVAEKQMFGGLAFLINGNMAVAASGQSGLMVRTDADQSLTLAAETPAQVMEMRGKTMPGWLRIETDHMTTDSELTK